MEEGSRKVDTAGPEALVSNQLFKGIPILIRATAMPGNLIELDLMEYEVILGMDWHTLYKAHLDCRRGKVRFEGKLPRVEF